MKFMRELTAKETRSLVSLCGGVLVLLSFALLLGGTTTPRQFAVQSDGSPQTAATWLADQQGVARDGDWPDFETCWVNLMEGQYGMSKDPKCPGNEYEFWSGAFSIHKTGTAAGGRSVSIRTSYSPENYVEPITVPKSCPESPQGWDVYDDGSGNCYDTFGTYLGPATCGQPPAGYAYVDPHYQSGLGCQAHRVVPEKMNSWIDETSGPSPVQLAAGESMTIEWSCLPKREVKGWGCYGSGGGWFGSSCGSTQYTRTIYNKPIATSATGSRFSTSNNLRGSVTVTPPVGARVYSVSCDGYGAPAMSIGVVVGEDIEVGLPTIHITGNGQNPVSVTAGESVLIRGTYAAAPGDSLLYTALNDYEQHALPGTAWTPPGEKTYTFVPSQPGTYVFYPAVQTTLYPAWNNYGKSLTVTVSCPEGTTSSGGSCACPAGFVFEGGTCVPEGECDAHEVDYPACNCEPGFTRNADGECVPVTCDGANEVPPACECGTGYVRSGGVCVLPAAVDIKANGANTARVRLGGTVLLTWTTTNIESGSCIVRNSSGAHISSEDSRPAPGLGISFVKNEVYTLTCADEGGGPVSDSVRVTPIPAVEEI